MTHTTEKKADLMPVNIRPAKGTVMGVKSKPRSGREAVAMLAIIYLSAEVKHHSVDLQNIFNLEIHNGLQTCYKDTCCLHRRA